MHSSLCAVARTCLALVQGHKVRHAVLVAVARITRCTVGTRVVLALLSPPPILTDARGRWSASPGRLEAIVF